MDGSLINCFPTLSCLTTLSGGASRQVATTKCFYLTQFSPSVFLVSRSDHRLATADLGRHEDRVPDQRRGAHSAARGAFRRSDRMTRRCKDGTNRTSLFSEKPLVFGDIQGGFYLLGFGFFCTFIVHLCLIVKVRCFN